MGRGPSLLLLHGFPQTHLMWYRVAPLLAQQFTLICADLRGYGQSSCPPSDAAHTPYSKRVMAADMIAVMKQLGFESFSVAGHDRGGRVAYRLALDFPQAIERLAVLDILPTSEVWHRADKRLAIGYWPWSLLAQEEPLPEQLLLAAPASIVDNALGGWGSDPGAFPASIRQAYIDALANPARVHAICEDYRAAATLDDEQDQADYTKGHRIQCPLLVLWGQNSVLNSWYTKAGGPLAIWSDWGRDVAGQPIRGGHFFPEESPLETAQQLGLFFANAA
ncbi:alpha/beta fold hydrolase [Spirosoma arboris]|nr:alpha/beta hydrolase [Spirosoma arboris]